MTTPNPITPPPELLREWCRSSREHEDLEQFWRYIATQAAQWGADQELEACVEWFQEFYKTESWVKHDLKHFRAARRPKPPSLKEQALEQLGCIQTDLNKFGMGISTDTIRRALNELPDN
jgi:hypothetical protein